MTESRLDERLGSRGAAIGVAMVAALFRLPWIGRLGLYGDEDVSTLAVRGILEAGWPRLPSGHGYWRGPLFHYLGAPLAGLDVDWVPRLLSVAASVITAYLVVRLGRRWVGGTAAFLGALLFAVSLMQIDPARQFRMYALYQLVALLVFAAVFRAWSESKLLWAALAAGGIAVAMQVHLLGGTLVALLALVAARATTRNLRLACVVLIAVFALWLPQQRAASRAAHMGGLPPAEQGEAVDAPDRDLFGLEPLAFGQELLGTVPFAGLVLLVAAAGALLSLPASAGASPWRRLVAATGIGACVGLAAAHQLGMAGVVFLLLVAMREDFYPAAAGRRTLIGAAALVVVLAGLWGLAGILQQVSPPHLVMGLFGRKIGRFVRLLVSWPLSTALLALVGTGFVLARSWRGTARAGERFAVIVVFGMAAGRSILAGSTQERYLADVWVLWQLLAAVGVVAIVSWVARRAWAPGVRRAGIVVAAGACLAVVLVTPGTSPATTLGYLSRTHGEPPPGTGAVAGFAADFRSVADWLARHRGPGERLAATDWLTAACYLGPVDGWIRYSAYGHQSVMIDGVVRDVYLHAKVLSGLDALRSFLDRGPAWVVIGGGERNDPVKLDEATRDWIERHEPAFTAADGVTRVYRFDGDGSAAAGMIDAAGSDAP